MTSKLKHYLPLLLLLAALPVFLLATRYRYLLLPKANINCPNTYACPSPTPIKNYGTCTGTDTSTCNFPVGIPGTDFCRGTASCVSGLCQYANPPADNTPCYSLAGNTVCSAGSCVPISPTPSPNIPTPTPLPQIQILSNEMKFDDPPLRSCQQLCGTLIGTYNCIATGTDAAVTNGQYYYNNNGACTKRSVDCFTAIRNISNTNNLYCEGREIEWTNCKCLLIATPTPFIDLSIANLQVNPPITQIDRPTALTFTINNSGTLPATPIRYNVTLTPDGITELPSPQSSNVCTNSTILPGGGSCNVTLLLTYPTSGTKFIAVSLDPQNLVTESNEGNNAVSLQMFVNYPTNTPAPTLGPTNPPTPTTIISSCNGICGTGTHTCGAGLACINGICRNTSCTADITCTCNVPTPSPTPQISQPLTLRLKFQGALPNKVLLPTQFTFTSTQHNISAVSTPAWDSSIAMYTVTLPFPIPQIVTYSLSIKPQTHLRHNFGSFNTTTGLLDLTSYELKPGDINNDNYIDISDYSLFLRDFNPGVATSSFSDLNFDSIVDISDYSLFVTNFNPGVPGT